MDTVDHEPCPDQPAVAQHYGQTLRHVADQLRTKWPKLGAFIDESEADVLAHRDFSAQYAARSTVPTRWNA